MFGGSSAPSLADIAAVTRNNDGNNDGFGGNNGWWILIILFAIFGGWGNNGNYGNNGGGCDRGETTIVMTPPTMGGYGMSGYGFTDAAIQRGFDNQTVISKLDGINSGICSLGYDQLAQMNGIGTTVMQTGFGLQQAIANSALSAERSANALSTQLAGCCCDLRAAVKDVMYTMATDTCALKTEIHETGDRILNSQQWGFNQLTQTIKDGFADMQRQSDQRYIAELERKLNNCDRDSALQGMATYVINQVRPTPIPAWPVANPWAQCNCNTGCNTCCG